MTPIRSPVSCLTRAQELRAVGGAAAGLGGDRPHRPTGRRARPGGAGVQRGDGPVHRGCAESAGAVQPLAETDDAGETVEDAKPVARRRADQHAAIVGAEIERGEDRSVRAACKILPRVVQLRGGFKLNGGLHRHHGRSVRRMTVTWQAPNAIL